ncbi:hypothetical protein K503DRAFT_862083 [Rhizopogon vinicolor AM-OR11-026]|uniref:Uncharacterized protein n=1 Tax=Rhizopogon vinicolor AM-OR11-026 TaxID=1314800 RepID=A0A1B7NFP2_9AGAM|nr:hypothetical protein K503DRAFT_862083 [Rhizopogon vinicolor AM-OR11-026]
MFNASLQETLARYSDPSRNPYSHVLQSKPSELRSPQHLAQPLAFRPRLDVSFDVPPTNQWGLKLKLDIEAFEQSPGSTLQVLDSRGCYIQSLSLRSKSQSYVQQVLPEHPSFVTSSRRTGAELSVVTAVPTHAAANVIERTQFVPNVAARHWSISSDDAESVLLAPASQMQPSASGSHADPGPIITLDMSYAPIMPEISRPTNVGNVAMERTRRMQKGDAERRDAERMELERRESATEEAEMTEREICEPTANEAERTETEGHEPATNEAERMETDNRESVTTEAERTETENRESATKDSEAENIERETHAESVVTSRKDPRASAPTKTLKLLRIERKLNNKDLFMGWYKSESSSELRYPHECIAPKLGDVYVHCFRKEGNQKFQLWVRQINRGMTIWVKAHIFHIHPKLVDRRLTLTTTGEPYWATRISLMASGSRERAGKIAEMILYN